MNKIEQRISACKQEWHRFINGIRLHDSTIIPQPILESWERCRVKGVDPFLKKIPVVLHGEALEERLKINRKLIKSSRPFMENLLSFVEGSGFVAALFDREGYLLEIVGDEDVVAEIRQGDFIVGACWREEHAGTNGVGTILHHKKPLQIFATEHYCVNSQKMTASGAPIYDPEGNIAGGIAITGTYLNVNPHTPGMVVAAARAIENALKVRKSSEKLQFAQCLGNAIIESILEALIATDDKGGILLINNNARNMFGLDDASLIGKDVRAVFGFPNQELLAMIESDKTFTDTQVRIVMRGKPNYYTVTCNTINNHLNEAVGRMVVLNEIKRAKKLVNKIMGARAKFRFDDIIGNNGRFQKTIEQARMVSESDSTVLLLGESGTGKDILAQAIHNSSKRHKGPYIAINCGAIPRELITSELFGYSEGAFTGSRRGGYQGKFELADGGTILLDEIGEMPLDLQSVLLRVIEEKSITRIGGTEITPVDVRLIAATNKNLRDEVKKGTFREDLYYRLNVVTIQMAPLRERKDDIPVLTTHFVGKIAGAMDKRIDHIEARVIERLMAYSWPGNTRELQNIIERMINIARTNVLTIDLVPSEILNTGEILHIHQGSSGVADFRSPKELERDVISNLMQSNYTKQQIANKLGIARSTLYRKFEVYNIDY